MFSQRAQEKALRKAWVGEAPVCIIFVDPVKPEGLGTVPVTFSGNGLVYKIP